PRTVARPDAWAPARLTARHLRPAEAPPDAWAAARLTDRRHRLAAARPDAWAAASAPEPLPRAPAARRPRRCSRRRAPRAGARSSRAFRIAVDLPPSALRPVLVSGA